MCECKEKRKNKAAVTTASLLSVCLESDERMEKLLGQPSSYGRAERVPLANEEA